MRSVILALLVGTATSQYTGECNRAPPTTTDACLAAILRGGTVGGAVFNDIFRTTAGLTGQQLYWTGKLHNTGCGFICAGCQPGWSLPPYDCPGQYTCASVAGGCPFQVNANGANYLDRYWVHPCRTTTHAPAGQCPIGSCLADGDASGYFPWEGYIFDLGNKCNNVAIFAENDHGPQPCESIEYTVFLTNNPSSRDVLFPLTYADSDPNKWNRAVLKRVYTKGWIEVRAFQGAAARPACGDTAQFGVEEDSMVPVYGLPSGTVFRYAAIVAGNDGKDFPECAYHSNEAELDAVAGLTEGFDAICPDLDGDGKDSCSCPSPLLDKNNCDCNDNDNRIFMGAVEPCDATFDYDCDGKFPTACTGGATCVNHACQADCLVDNWSQWTTTCSLFCGGGTFQRTRSVTQPRQGAGAACPPLLETQPCNTRPCVPCNGLTTSTDGTFLASCGATQLADGDRCSIVCDAGYSLVPAGSERQCVNGVLTGTSQSCVGQPCNAGTIPVPALGEANSCTGTIAHNAYCSIRCLPGSTLTGPPNRQCIGSIFSGVAQDCIADCGAFTNPAPANGNLGSCDGLQSGKQGDTCSYACDSSYAVTGNPMRCNAGQWTGTPQTCVLVQPGACQGFIYAPQNGNLGNCTGIIPNHAICQYDCFPGYELRGNPITCRDAVLDDRLQTSCWPMDCATILPPANGQTGNCIAPMTHGTRCNIDCDVGYQRQGVSQGCALGNISYSQRCVESPCNAPLKLGQFVTGGNGNMGNCTGSVAAGALCSIACDAGYIPSNPGRVCSKGDFLGTTQTCQKITIPCPALRSAPYNGNIGNCGQQINDGDYCSFQCDTGYSLSAANRQCVLGVLSQPAQTCRPDNCLALGGSESPVEGNTGTCGHPITHGDYCNFECNDNVTFALVGPHRQCWAGVLLGTPQTCVALAATDCRPLNVVPPKGSLGDCGSKLSNGQNCSIECDNNYFLKPDNSSRWCNNGVLEGPTQWCEAELETPPPTNPVAPTAATRVPTQSPTAAIGVTVTITFTKPLTPDELPTLIKEITTALDVPINRIYVVSSNGTTVTLGFMPPSTPGGESATDLANRFLAEWDKIKNGTGTIPGVVIKDLDTNSTRPATVTSALTPVQCADGSLAASQSACAVGTAPSPSAKAAFPVGAVVGGVVGGLAFCAIAILLILCCRKGGKRAGAVEMA